jgi:hypothetical protein
LSVNLSDSSPAAPSGANVHFQKDNSSPTNISAYIVDSDASNKGVIQLTGDLAGTAALPKVAGIRGVSVQNVVPTDKQTLSYNASATRWEPTIPAQALRTATGSIGPLATETIEVDWNTPYAADNYIVSCLMEDASGFLQVISFSYVSTGVGILVRVQNSDNATHNGFIHSISRVTI